MAIYHSVPALLATAEEAFSAQLRARNTVERVYSRGMMLYWRIIRENIVGVLRNVFPLFCRRLNDKDIDELLDGFLDRHQASQPEFHQIATELLLFIRQKSALSHQVLSLVEYEWLIYAVEIDESEVPRPQTLSLQTQKIDNIDIKKNPTLKIMALPFGLKKGEPYFEDRACLHYYALYRKNNNALYQKELGQSDLKILLEMNNHSVSASLLKEKYALCSLTVPFNVWLENKSNDELFSLIFKE